MKKPLLVYSNKDTKWATGEFLNEQKVDVHININKAIKDQKIFGFGGAFTDAATISYLSLDKSKRKEYLNAYFSKDGLGYTLGRYPIMSTDFSEHSYEYITKEGGIDSFDISTDKDRINFVKEALSLCPDMWLTAVPWSPCSFMKDNGEQAHGGRLLKEYYSLWAEVIAKTVKELDKQGIKVSCLSTQNEPLAKQTWESCIYTSEEEAIFLKDYLIPTVREYGYKDMSFMVWDHNRDLMYQRTKEVLSYMVNDQNIFGVAYHWYDRNCFEEVKKTHQEWPHLHILLTECCVELLCDDNSGLGSWENGLRYGINIIKDLNNGSEGYIDWNLSLFDNGGPNHVGNFCEAPLMINKELKNIKYMPSYYVIGHFSKYLRKGDTRIEATSDDKDVLATAFVENNGLTKIVIISENKQAKIVETKVDGRCYFFKLKPSSIITFII